MDSAEYSRKVAEAMGLRECRRDPGGFHPVGTPNRCKPPRADDTAAIWGGKQCIHPRQRGIDLADAMDREAVIAWLVEQGYRVEIAYTAGVADVRILRGETRVWVPRPTIEEALGQAVLAAIGGEQP